MTTFGWLHLTDLHMGQSGQEWPLQNVKDLFFEDLEYLHDKNGPWDLVLFTGDLTQRGLADQFKRLDRLLDSLWNRLQKLGSDPILLAVPGNHDLVRPEKTFAGHIIERYGDGTDDTFWGPDAQPYVQALRKAFENYETWWSTTPFLKDAHRKSMRTGELPGDFSFALEKDGARLGVVGLNSTFLQLVEGDRKGKLALAQQQFHKACGDSGPEWARQQQAYFLLTHQPPDWLTQEALDIYRGEISPPAILHVCGHMQESVLHTEAWGGADARRIWQGNSLFSQEPYETPNGKKHKDRRHGYSAGCLEMDGERAELRQWPRKLPGTEGDLFAMFKRKTDSLWNSKALAKDVQFKDAGG